MTHGEFAAQSKRTPFSISSIQLKCFTIFPFYLAFVIGFPVSQYSWQQRGGSGNDSKYLIKIKCYDLISAEKIVSLLYEAFERVSKSLAQSYCGPVIPSGYSKAFRSSRYHEIRKIKITVCTNCMRIRKRKFVNNDKTRFCVTEISDYMRLQACRNYIVPRVSLGASYHAVLS